MRFRRGKVGRLRVLDNSHKIFTDDCFRLKLLRILLKTLTKTKRKVTES